MGEGPAAGVGRRGREGSRALKIAKLDARIGAGTLDAARLTPPVRRELGLAVPKSASSTAASVRPSSVSGECWGGRAKTSAPSTAPSRTPDCSRATRLSRVVSRAGGKRKTVNAGTTLWASAGEP